MTRAKWWAGAAIVLLVIGGSASVASAHAELSASTPAANSVLPTAPTEIVLTFTEARPSTADPGSGRIDVVVRRSDGGVVGT